MFPEVICKLPCVRALDFSKNKITELPDFLRSSIGEMISLDELDLSYNQLISLPHSVKNLQNLEILHLEGNPLTQLPECMSELTGLRKLYLDRTIQIPREMFQLPDLEIFLIFLRP